MSKILRITEIILNIASIEEEIVFKCNITEIGHYAFEENKNGKDLNLVVPKSIKKIKDQNVLNWNIFYEGSEEEWNDVILEVGTSYLPSVYYYSEVEKTGHWHYDANGNREIW